MPASKLEFDMSLAFRKLNVRLPKQLDLSAEAHSLRHSASADLRALKASIGKNIKIKFDGKQAAELTAQDVKKVRKSSSRTKATKNFMA